MDSLSSSWSVMPWERSPRQLELKPGEIHVWKFGFEITPVVIEEFFFLLDEAERLRAGKFSTEALSSRWIFSRGKLKQLLGRYLRKSPDEISIESGINGKPYLIGDPLHFNLSHSEDWVLLAFCRDGEVGVDLEYAERDRPFDKLSRRFFSETEIAQLDGLDAAQQQAGFYRCWTRKEAFLKAMGLGITIPMKSFSVSLAEEAPVLLACESNPRAILRWKMSSLEVGEQYEASLVGRSFIRDVFCWLDPVS